ncbi:MAG TPA: tRNA uridine-5-carboxymethylaminomethyl(34) synthesis GTPase MnmE [Candidatus Omnitrophota bacterium]|nr:tRNA uridine-5-carboxymethylaminomethyl(34) synthesis GTPase MnmE [Candidatus Omnitrophota bacterium]
MHILHVNDTIAAIATPSGEGGIGIVRVSGAKSFEIADKIFIGPSLKKPSCFSTHTVHYGRIAAQSQDTFNFVDEVLLIPMRAPKTYTREDMIEIHCHGGLVAVRAVLNLVLQQGARLAERGEFTKRAFLSGRIDLAQAEAILDIIQAKTDISLRSSVRQLKGELTLELEALRENLADIYTQLEAIVNFPEDDIDTTEYESLQEKNREACVRVRTLFESGQEGRILKEGAKVVICGKPNVGKSSILNVLLRQPRAIVSPLAGTTRDTIEELAQINDVPVQLVDTAGILQPRDAVEQEAVHRSRLNIESADLVLFVLDISEKVDKRDEEIIRAIEKKNVILVFNKSDRPVVLDIEEVQRKLPECRSVSISALQKSNIEQLKEQVVSNLLHGHPLDPHRLFIHNARQLEALSQCLQALLRAQEAFCEQIPPEFIAEEIRTAIHYLDQITGKDISQDILERIFESFCIGK